MSLDVLKEPANPDWLQEPSALRQLAAELHPHLVENGFGTDMELVGVTGSGSSSWLSRLIAGVYVQMPMLRRGELPCYKKLQKLPSSALKFSFAEIYIFWCVQTARWKLSDKPNYQGRVFASSPNDWTRPRLVEARRPWTVFVDGKAGRNNVGEEDTHLAVLSVFEFSGG
eukprot:TRINITY_DN12419_c0_g1_i3.p1 TRINITY_DN12419_c0_g1~~TRINITY_DN12419_c0_g1_i3.p1  ORF type:complete len:170 (-),score=29.65 TRINITY_DN12419_c0_g1_i3:50-559(-)